MFKNVMIKVEEILKDFKYTITFFLGAIAVITFYIGADNYINNQIENKITDETYINKLAHVLRPFSIFDKEGIITYDHGGERFIKNIAVKKKKNGDFESVIITTNVYLQNAPILTYIGYENYAYASKRIDTYQWKFKLSSHDVLMAEGNYEKVEPIFIVEITK